MLNGVVILSHTRRNTTILSLIHIYGAECSSKIEENKKEVLSFCADIEIIPIGLALSEYAHQKAILRKKRSLIDDLDLLIGSTAVAIDCIMVTENVKHPVSYTHLTHQSIPSLGKQPHR